MFYVDQDLDPYSRTISINLLPSTGTIPPIIIIITRLLMGNEFIKINLSLIFNSELVFTNPY